ncbi:GroES-like domain-containing protein [Rozella allomycis CSF55]|uniref:GroES-like domain-containing protein n=1 Tax=Rozella allomycis (strain CSF55) TaxID=988480 RepID=A0A075AUG1_ROZAC|nr:GroES-like domain-containing protein [Rozella allomycis CSF55]|eukprot:EPZ33800.1 GroES-like domain-containing protein [Rozella allomycis CSF55]
MIQEILGLTKETSTSTQPIYSGDMMKAVLFGGNKCVEVKEVPRPKVTEPNDAVIKVLASTICGSDLHLYHNAIPEMKKGDILGHECVGIVVAIGSNVNTIKNGDRVVVSSVIACGQCENCKTESFSLCDTTNSSGLMEWSYGQKTAGLFGYSHLTGGYPGGQAEYLRVPFADINCLPISEEKLSNDILVLLSDVLPTSWHACELAEISNEMKVGIWGAGPIGLMTARWALLRGASPVIVVDKIPSRLEAARSIGCLTINYETQDPLKVIKETYPRGLDAVVDCVGFRYAKSWTHAIERTLKMETDSIDSLSECIYCVKKGGNIAIIGDYLGYANHFPIGAMMEKGLTVRGGQLYCQKYWKKILDMLVSNQVDPSFLITHHYNLEEASEAYKLFDEKVNGVLKVILNANQREE